VLEKSFENINGVVRTKQSQRIPVVFSREEILRLRLKDIDFERLAG